MNLTEYYAELNATAEALEADYPGGIVYVTSIKNREKNTVPGQTLSANYRNAARVITDGTHRLSSAAEIEAFLELQENNRKAATISEQRKRQQYIVVVDQDQPANAGLLGTRTRETVQARQGTPAVAPPTTSRSSIAVADGDEEDS